MTWLFLSVIDSDNTKFKKAWKTQNPRFFLFPIKISNRVGLIQKRKR